MVRHLVMWKPAPGQDKSKLAEEILKSAQEFLKPIDGVLYLDVWKGCQIKEEDHAIALYIDFSDRQAVEDYMTHPGHLAFKEFIKGKVSERVAIDCDASE